MKIRKNSQFNKCIRFVLQVLILSILFTFVCSAESYIREDGKSYFTVDQIDVNSMKNDAALICGEEEFYRLDTVFLSGRMTMASAASNDSKLVYSEVYNYPLELMSKDGFICLLTKRAKNDNPIDVTIRYSTDGEKFSFEKSTGEICQAAYLNCARIAEAEEGIRYLHLQLTQDDLAALSYFQNEEFGFYVLKMAKANIVVHSVSVDLKSDEYVYVRAIYDGLRHDDPTIVTSYSTQVKVNSGVEFSCEDNGGITVITDNVVDLHLTDRTAGYLQHSIQEGLSESKVLATVSYEQAAVAGFGNETSGENSETGTFAEEFLETDIEDRSYSGLADGEASTIYTDAYLFAKDQEIRTYAISADLLGKDLLVNVFGVSESVGNTQMDAEEAAALPGMGFGTEQLPENAVYLQVSSMPASPYAGELTVKLNGETAVASPSDAVKPEGTAAVTDTYSFAKVSGESYTVSSGSLQMTDAFLKKASYCAVDEDGTVIAVYNTHGRLLELAEERTEAEVAYYVLLPETAEGSSFSEISITRNDQLGLEREYARLIYTGLGGGSVSPAVVLSGYCDADMEADLSFSADLMDGIFRFNSCTFSELTAEALEGWTLENVPEEKEIPEEEEIPAEGEAAEITPAEEGIGETIPDAVTDMVEATPENASEQPAEADAAGVTETETLPGEEETLEETQAAQVPDQVIVVEVSSEEEDDPIEPVPDDSVEETAEGGAIVTDATHDFEKLIEEGADEASINGPVEESEDGKDAALNPETAADAGTSAEDTGIDGALEETAEGSMAEALEEMVQMDNLEDIIEENVSEEVIVLN